MVMNRISSIAYRFPVGVLAGLALAASLSAETAEEKILGAPCCSRWQLSSETFAAQREINRRHDEAMKQGDVATAIAMRKELIRSQCKNDYLWFFLAELYIENNRNSDALVILAYLYDKKNDEIERRLLTEGNALHPLASTKAFQSSALKKKLGADRERLAPRKQKYRGRLAALPPERRPPQDYTATGACPSECCKFQTWDVLADTVLYDRPNGEQAVGRVNKGDKIEGLTGEVHIRPIPVAVRLTPEYASVPKAGSIVFLLDHLGEGIGRVWHEGKVIELDVAGNIHEHCPFPAERCWGEYIEEPPGEEHWGIWWVKVKTAEGVTGWTKDNEHFGNIDGRG